MNMDSIWTWLRKEADKACLMAKTKPDKMHSGAFPASLLMAELERRGLKGADILQWRAHNLTRLRWELASAAQRNGCVILPIKGIVVFAPK